MSHVVDALLGVSGAAAYTLVGVLIFGEAALLIGLFLPGELAAILGGVVVSYGHASLPVMLAVAVGAAVTGDSVGYEVGRHFGRRMLAWPIVRDRFGDQVERASAFLQDKGGRAVFLGRWTALLRALVPGLAGAAGTPYGRFLLFNVAGGVAWATTFVVLGYVAGASWRQVERIAGQASLLLLGVLALVWATRVGTRRAVAHADEVRARLGELSRSSWLRGLRAQATRGLRWAARRVTPGARRGLGWTVSTLVAFAGAWVAGAAVQDLFGHEELAVWDRPVARWIAAHSTPAAVRVAQVVVDASSAPIGMWAVATAAVAVALTVRRADALRVAVAGTTALGLAWTLGRLLPLSTVGTRFPAVGTAVTVALLAACLPVVARRRFAAAIRLAGVGTAVVVVLAAAELVAGRAALSGLVGGVGLGALVGAAGELVARLDLAGAGEEDPG